MTDLALILIGLFVPTAAAVWIWSDADDLRSRGVKISPFVWALFVWLLLIIGLPVYLLMRTIVWTRQIKRNDALDLSDLDDLPEPDMSMDHRYAPWKVA